MDGIRKSTGSQTIQAHGFMRIQVRVDVDVDCYFFTVAYVVVACAWFIVAEEWKCVSVCIHFLCLPWKIFSSDFNFMELLLHFGDLLLLFSPFVVSFVRVACWQRFSSFFFVYCGIHCMLLRCYLVLPSEIVTWLAQTILNVSAYTMHALCMYITHRAVAVAWLVCLSWRSVLTTTGNSIRLKTLLLWNSFDFEQIVSDVISMMP